MMAINVGKVLARAVLAICLLASLQGCPLILAGAAGGGVLIAIDRRTLGAQAEDREIQLKAVAQFARYLPAETHISTTAFNRRVLLTGEVPNEETKQKAAAIARNIDNVQGIVNELAVQGSSSMTSRSNDALLTAKVKASLVKAKDLSAHAFKVVTERGIVYLMGLVTVDEGRRAADIASRVRGVLRVVKVFQYVTPEEAAKLSPDAHTKRTSARNPAPISSAMPDSSANAQPDQQQAPAPISDSAPVLPGNANKASH